MRFSFGDVQVDLARYELSRAGAAVALEPQAFDVLVYLLTHRDRVIAKEELMDAVWGGRFVSETAVTSRIKQVRRAVGDDGQAQRVIRTLHGRGYRFVADVVSEAAPSVVSELAAVRESGASAPVHYALSDGLNVAYQVSGAGVRDIVLVAGFVSHLELDWADPRHAHFLDRLGSLGRLIRFDKRGTGMSDRPDGVPDLETRMHDVLAVMDAAGSERAVLFGYSEGAPMAALFAAAHPDRVDGLVLYGGYAKRLVAPDYPWAPTPQQRADYADRLAGEWSWEADMRVMCPSADDAMAVWWGRRARAAATPATVRALIAMNTLVDVRGVLGSIRVPTLVLHRRGDQDSRLEEGRYLAEHIPSATFVELAGADHFVAVNPDQVLDQVEPFVGGLGVDAGAPRLSLAAVVAGRDADGLDALVAGGGERRQTIGGGVVVTFDGPATALRALRSIAMASSGYGVQIAEIPDAPAVLADEHVTVATALADGAPAGTVWAPDAVAALTAGAGLLFEPAGEVETPVGRQRVLRMAVAPLPAETD